MQINNLKTQFFFRLSRKFILGVIFLLFFSNLSLLAQLPTKTVRIFANNSGTTKSSKNKLDPKEKLILQVETADTEATQAYGLSHRKFLPEKQGMLFIFKAPQIGSFWGKNTLIPLDLIYIDHDRKIVQISKIQPHDLTAVPSQDKIQHALELNQGTADKYGLQVGDRLIWN